MISALLPPGRTMGAMPLSPAAPIHASAVSTVMEPCSLSSRIQSNPRWPSISTTGGEGKVHMTPNAAFPAWSRCLRVFSRMDQRSPYQGLPARGRVPKSDDVLRTDRRPLADLRLSRDDVG